MRRQGRQSAGNTHQRIAIAAYFAAGLFCGETWAACAALDSGEPTLQESFDDLFGDVGDTPRVLDVAACRAEGSDAFWRTTGTSSASILFEIAGYADTNRFGLYDPVTQSSVFVDLQVFTGPDAEGDTRYIEFIANGAGGYTVQAQRRNGNGTVVQQVTDQATFASAVFGLYLLVPADGRTYYSDTVRNTDGMDHMLAYTGNGATFDNDAPNRIRNTVFGPNDVIFAWEDRPAPGSDRDYQDFVVLLREIEGVTPVPLPAAGWLFGSVLLGMTGWVKRRRMPAR